MNRIAGMLLVAAAGATLIAAGCSRSKKLIEWGWDEPDPVFMRAHIEELEASPFDGIVYHVNYATPEGKPSNFSWQCWGRKAFTMDDLAPALADLRATPFRRLADNFLRFNVTPADVGWFDDWSAVLGNARLAAAVARHGRSRGVCFDTEPYENRAFWNFSRQPDTTAHGWSDHVAQARRRGAQLMEAFQDSFPDLTVFTSFGVSMPYEQQTRHRVPPRNQDYGLLVPFMDGMVDAARGRARIIDGFEGAYPVRDPSELARMREQARGPMLSVVSDPAKFGKVVSYGFGIWMDHDWQGKGWSTVHPDSNFRPPAQLEAVLRAAFKASDEYVWLYSEKPRWWTEQRTTRDLPEAYRNAVHRSRGKK